MGRDGSCIEKPAAAMALRAVCSGVINNTHPALRYDLSRVRRPHATSLVEVAGALLASRAGRDFVQSRYIYGKLPLPVRDSLWSWTTPCTSAQVGPRIQSCRESSTTDRSLLCRFLVSFFNGSLILACRPAVQLRILRLSKPAE